MGKRKSLGEFEQLVLLSLLALEEPAAYGMNVRGLLRDEAGRDVSVPTVYSALERLEAKGFVTSHVGEATPERGGRAKKLFRVAPAGASALRMSKQTLERMWAVAAMDWSAS